MRTQSKWEPWQEDIESPMNACCHQGYCAELKRESARLRAGLEVLQKDVEKMDLGLLYLRISELLEGEE